MTDIDCEILRRDIGGKAARGKIDLQLGNLEAAQEKVQVGPLIRTCFNC